MGIDTGWRLTEISGQIATRIKDKGRVYAEAQEREKSSVRTVSIDEMSGIQALERAAPSLPLRPGMVERHPVFSENA